MNPTAKTSVSALEAFRRFQNELLTQEALVARLTTPFREDSENVRIQKGIDLHKYIETGNPRTMQLAWDRDSVDAAIEESDLVGEHELWISGPLGDTHVHAKADLVNGLEIRDFKATGLPFKADDYEASYQWRLYLALTGCERFVYRVFEVPDDLPYRVVESHTFPLYPYPALLDDCLALVGDFRLWARGVPEIQARIAPPI
ncbi:hypothetical protein [Methylomagnum ishizawai]|uniref:hypothetical protein n=1 Tax=Methylomagnum ishizawai TaxID=1760988 RepID=UPI001C3279EB|nr:hypothetical protein [Methylomagnum ishizawai]BBL73171.1 hypothetical protein MishRS11D_02690 [Methylomagnum ishizawai]